MLVTCGGSTISIIRNDMDLLGTTSQGESDQIRFTFIKMKDLR